MMNALIRRAAGMQVAPVQVDLLDVAAWLNWKTIGIAERTGASPSRMGAEAEWAVVPCRDGYIALVYRAQDWEALKAATGEAALNDSRFGTPAGRKEHVAALNAVFRQAFMHLSRAEIRNLAVAYRLPLGPVWAPSELLQDPHMVARGFFEPVELGGAGVSMPRLPVKWSGETFRPAVFAEAVSQGHEPAK